MRVGCSLTYSTPTPTPLGVKGRGPAGSGIGCGQTQPGFWAEEGPALRKYPETPPLCLSLVWTEPAWAPVYVRVPLFLVTLPCYP